MGQLRSSFVTKNGTVISFAELLRSLKFTHTHPLYGICVPLAASSFIYDPAPKSSCMSLTGMSGNMSFKILSGRIETWAPVSKSISIELAFNLTLFPNKLNYCISVLG